MKYLKKTIIIVSSLICILFTIWTVVLCIPSKKQDFDVIFMGDSIFGNYRDETSIPAVFQEISSLKSYNAGFGGTLASYLSEDYSGRDIIENACCLVSMTRAACFKDYTYQTASLPLRNVASLTYFSGAIDATAKVNYDSAKIIVIENGVNDYFAGQKPYINEMSDPLVTYEGALDYSIELLKKYYPDAIIVVASPVGCYRDITGFVDAAKNVVARQSVYLFDAYGLSIVNDDNINEITEDGIHLNEEGRRMYAEYLYEYLCDEGLIGGK